MAFPKSRLLRFILGLAVALILLIGFGPWIAISFFGKSIIEKRLRDQLACSVDIAGLGGGWSGANIEYIKLGQPPGFESVSEPLAEARGISIHVSLLKAIFGNYDADVRVDSINATLARAASGITNLQKIMRPRIVETRESRPQFAEKKKTIPEFQFSLALGQGRVVARDLEAGAEATIDKITISAGRSGVAVPVNFSLKCEVRGAGVPGNLALTGFYDLQDGDGEAELRPEHLDLSAFSPFIAATKFATKTTGQLDGGIKLTIAKSGAIAGDGRLAVTNLQMEGGRLGSPVADSNIILAPKFAYSPDTNVLTIDGFELAATSAHITGTGTLDPARGGKIKLKIDGDLAKAQRTLAAFFPKDAALAGRISGDVEIEANPGGASAFRVDLNAEGVRAAGAGVAAAVPTDGSLKLNGSASADFREITVRDGSLNLGPIASGAFHGKWKKTNQPKNMPQTPPGPGEVDAEVHMQLSLAGVASRFAALLPKGLRLAGDLACDVKITTDETQEMRFDTKFAAAKLFISGAEIPADGPEWLAALAANPVEESFVNITLVGSSDPRFDRFELTRTEVTTSSGALKLNGTANGGLWNLASSLKAKIHAEASLEKFAPYLAAFLPARLTLAGDVKSDVDLSTENGYVRGPISLEAARIVVGARKRGAGPASAIDASLDRLANHAIQLNKLIMGGDLTMNRAQNELRIPNFKLRADPEVLDCSGILTSTVDASAAGGVSSFDGEIKADLEPLINLAGAFIPAGTHAAGAFAMKGNISREKSNIAWNLAGKIAGFSAEAPGFAPIPVEREVSMEFIGKYEPAPGGFDCIAEKTIVAASSGKINIDISGKVIKTKDNISGDGRGTCGVDLAWVANLMPGYLPAGSSISGMLKSNMTLATSGDSLRFESSANVDQFRFAPPEGSGPPVADRKLAFDIIANYDNSKDDLTVQKLDVATADRWLESKIHEIVVSGMRSGRGIRMNGAGEIRADVNKIIALAPGVLPAGASLGGTLISNFNISNSGALTKFQSTTNIEQFKFAGPAQSGAAPFEFTDAKLALDVGGALDTARSEIAFERANLSTAGGGIAATAKELIIKALLTDRRLEGDFVAAVDGDALGRILSPWIPKNLKFTGKGNFSAKLAGGLGKEPLHTIKASGDFAFPSVVYDDLRIDAARGAYTLADGLFNSEGIQGDFVKSDGDAVKRGKLAASVRMKIDDDRMPFGLSFKSTSIPAGHAVGAPLSYVFPLFAGNFQFATFDGVLDSEGSVQGEASDWKQTLNGSIDLEMKQVKLVGSQEFGQVLSILKLNALNSTHDSIKEHIKVGGGKFVIERIEVDGDPSKLPLVGGVSFDGVLALGVDLGRANLGKKLDSYRPLIGLFRPEFTGTVTSPGFGIAPPSPDQLLQAAAKMAAGSLLVGGSKLDLGKLSKIGSLGDLASMAESDKGDSEPNKPGPGVEPRPPGPQKPHIPIVDAPASAGGMPVNLNRSFRALAKANNKFDYAALNASPELAADLKSWLEAPPPPKHVSTPEARIADLLNRYEVALALAVAAELQDKMFDIVHGKKGVHDIKNFFDRKTNISGANTSFDAAKDELITLAGDEVLFSIPGAAEDLPWIDRTGVDATNVKKNIEARAVAYLARVQLTPKGLIAVPQYVFRNLRNDEAKIKEMLKKHVSPKNPAHAKIDGAKLTKFPESLELDRP
ncbi:MAG: DUF748 domain-containing protein [Planctomycetes bacterium]|nr:DUF748 domain-containing protein [Planctomycetota bacterium]